MFRVGLHRSHWRGRWSMSRNRRRNLTTLRWNYAAIHWEFSSKFLYLTLLCWKTWLFIGLIAAASVKQGPNLVTLLVDSINKHQSIVWWKRIFCNPSYITQSFALYMCKGFFPTIYKINFVYLYFHSRGSRTNIFF